MSFIKVIDEGLKSFVFTKFATDMELTVQNTGVILEPRDVSLRKIAEKRGQNSVEFISIWRESVELDRARMNSPIARRGFNLSYTNANQTDLTIAKAVPVKLRYSIRWWSRDYDKITDAVETFLFWFQVNPNLIFNYNTLYPLEFDIIPQADVQDESTIVEQYTKGLYFVNKADIILDGWVIESTTSKTITKILVDIYSREVINSVNVDTLLNTYTIESTIQS